MTKQLIIEALRKKDKVRRRVILDKMRSDTNSQQDNVSSSCIIEDVTDGSSKIMVPLPEKQKCFGYRIEMPRMIWDELFKRFNEQQRKKRQNFKSSIILDEEFHKMKRVIKMLESMSLSFK